VRFELDGRKIGLTHLRGPVVSPSPLAQAKAAGAQTWCRSTPRLPPLAAGRAYYAHGRAREGDRLPVLYVTAWRQDEIVFDGASFSLDPRHAHLPGGSFRER